MAVADIQYATDADGNPTAVIVPIDLWREIRSEHEPSYLLKSPAMRERLLQARGRTEGIPLEDAAPFTKLLRLRNGLPAPEITPPPPWAP